MKTRIVASALFMLATVLSVHAADTPQAEAAKDKWNSMSSDQKAAAKEKAREKWDAMKIGRAHV